MLYCNKVSSTKRITPRDYQTACIAVPHPEYMCQGGPMTSRSFIIKFADSIKQCIPDLAMKVVWI